jgi:hypothetical protein
MFSQMILNKREAKSLQFILLVYCIMGKFLIDAFFFFALGSFHHVNVAIVTDVSEVYIAFIFRAEELMTSER